MLNHNHFVTIVIIIIIIIIIIRIRSDFDKHLDKKYCAKMFFIKKVKKKLKNDDFSTFN